MRRWVAASLVAVAVVGLAAAGVTYATITERRAREARLAAIDTAEEFVAAVGRGDEERLDRLAPGRGAGARHAGVLERLQVTGAELTLEAVDFDVPAPGDATATYTATLALAGLGDWSYESSFVLAPAEDGWEVEWTPRVVHPELEEGQRLDRARSWPPRAPILDRNGSDLAAGPFGALVGTVGDVTAEQLEELGHPYQPGDTVGQSGLQRSMERRLAGQPGGEVRVVGEDGTVLSVLQEFPPEEPQPVHTTLDPAVQAAGQSALAPIGAPSALVAVDIGTGELRAVVNSPPGGFDRALSGRYPPGSTFKVVTTAALLAHGLDPEETVACPRTINIGGRSFRNAGFAALGTITFREAFAESCNTAFVGQADTLPEGALADVAEQFGFNVDYDIGVPVADARFPPPEDAVEHAAAAIGQGRVEATPLHMATVAAAAGRGQWRPPRILADEDRPEGAAPLPPALPGQLADLMRTAVAVGTGTAAQVPGTPVAGKTGTAEYGTGTRTHAWFIAFRGNLAVAVLVEGGGFGGEVAAPAAARFYSALG